jgi:hypothetical protein
MPALDGMFYMLLQTLELRVEIEAEVGRARSQCVFSYTVYARVTALRIRRSCVRVSDQLHQVRTPVAVLLSVSARAIAAVAARSFSWRLLRVSCLLGPLVLQAIKDCTFNPALVSSTNTIGLASSTNSNRGAGNDLRSENTPTIAGANTKTATTNCFSSSSRSSHHNNHAASVAEQCNKKVVRFADSRAQLAQSQSPSASGGPTSGRNHDFSPAAGHQRQRAGSSVTGCTSDNDNAFLAGRLRHANL